jgi:transaldolase
MELNTTGRLSERVRDFVLGLRPARQQRRRDFPLGPSWERLVTLGTEPWLDSGDVEDIAGIWTREMTALTTNNTLLNKEIQTGSYDELVAEAAKMLAEFELSDQQLKLEIAFILNAVHGLKLAGRFDAMVSVEEHTDLAHDVAAAVWYGRRYHEISPDRFYVKVPLTPAGLLAARQLGIQGVAVNLTLGFSARQNYLAARVASPAFVNVFLGRLNTFVADNGLGDGSYVGEKATLASQSMLHDLHTKRELPTRQIAASLRDGQQVRDLAGVDVMTIPPKVAREFLELEPVGEDLVDRTRASYRPGVAGGVDQRIIALDTLWEVPHELTNCIDELEREDLDAMGPGDLLEFARDRGCGDLLVAWRQNALATSAAEGKIPRLSNWIGQLASRRIGLDALMNLAGLGSFSADQQAMDQRVTQVLDRAGITRHA